jgi:hypothetical protein
MLVSITSFRIEHDFNSPQALRGIVATRRAAWPKLLGNVEEYSVGEQDIIDQDPDSASTLFSNTLLILKLMLGKAY